MNRKDDRELYFELCVHEPQRRASSGLGDPVRTEQGVF